MVQRAFAAEQLALYAAVTSHVAARLQDDPEGERAYARANVQMQSLGVRAPSSFVQMLPPTL